MKTTSMLAAGLALALAAPLPAPAQHAGHGAGHGGPTADGTMSPEMHEQMAQMHGGEGPAPEAGHDAHHAGPGAPAGAPSTEAYRAANTAMHEAMDIAFTGDADVDFARGMIGHHEGAIAMARVVIEHGQDAELRRLAEEIIEAQEAEIEFLRAWLAEHEG